MPFPYKHHSQSFSPGRSIKDTLVNILTLLKSGKIPFLAKKQQLPKQTRRVIFVNFLYGATGILGGLFVNIFLWKQSHDFLVLIKYNLIRNIIILAAFFLVGFVLYRLKLRFLMQLGLFVHLLKYLLLIIFREDAPQIVWYLGFLDGLGVGLYAAAHNVFEYVLTNDNNRDTHFGLKASFGYIASVIFPVLGGLIIIQTWIPFLTQDPFANYYLLFSVVVFIFLISIFYIFQLPKILAPKIDGSHLFIIRRSSTWRLISVREFFSGLRGGSVVFLSSILAFTVLGNSEFNLGILISSFALLSALTAFFLGRVLTSVKGNRDRLAFGFIGASLMAVARVLYIAFFNFFGIIVSSIIKILAQPLFGVGLASTFYHAIDQSPQHQKEFFEYITLREISLAIGRILSVSAFFLFLKLGSDIGVAKIWFLILGFIPFVFWFLTWKFEDKISQKQPTLPRGDLEEF